jgi:hypothetical protein
MGKLLVLSIDSEQYTNLCIDVVESEEEALSVLIKREKDSGREGLAINTIKNRDATWIEITDDSDEHNIYFLTAKVVDMPSEQYALIWWHAYDGVGFKVICCSDDEETVKMELDSYVRSNWDDELYSYEDYEEGDSSAIAENNGNKECEMLKVFNLKEVLSGNYMVF